MFAEIIVESHVVLSGVAVLYATERSAATDFNASTQLKSPGVSV